MTTPEHGIVSRADALYNIGQCEQAVSLLTTTLEKDSSRADILIKLCEILIDSNQQQRVLRLLTDSCIDDPSGHLNMLRGICNEMLGNLQETEKIAEKLYLNDNKRAHSLILKAKVAKKSGNMELAERNFREAITCDNKCAQGFLGLGYLMRQQKVSDASMDFFEKALMLSPSTRETAIAFHDAAIDTGEYLRAESAFRTALHSCPTNRRLRFLLIDLLLRQFKYDQAMAETESAMIDFGIDDGILSAALIIRRHLGPLSITKKPASQGSVSLCMIVKNELSFLSQCLHSAKPIVEEMIVVDTGSTDRTKDIATAFGAMVFEAEWENDFSKARNISLSMASGEWILVLDADEVLSPSDYNAIREIVKDRRNFPVAYSIQTRNYTYRSNVIGWGVNTGAYAEEKGSGWFPSIKVRLFTNDPRIRFSNPVHELVEPSLKTLGVPVLECCIPVHHYGTLQEERTNSKTKIYRDLGQNKLKSNHHNTAVLREQAIQCAQLEKHDQALKLWKKFVKRQPHSADAYVNMGTACWNLGRYAEAYRLAERAVELRPEMKEAKFNLALAMLMMGRAGESKVILQRLLKEQPDYSAAVFMHCVCCACIGKEHEVGETLKNLLSSPLGSYLGESFLDIAERLLTASQANYARRILEAAIEHKLGNPAILALLENCGGPV